MSVPSVVHCPSLASGQMVAKDGVPRTDGRASSCCQNGSASVGCYLMQLVDSDFGRTAHVMLRLPSLMLLDNEMFRAPKYKKIDRSLLTMNA